MKVTPRIRLIYAAILRFRLASLLLSTIIPADHIIATSDMPAIKASTPTTPNIVQRVFITA